MRNSESYLQNSHTFIYHRLKYYSSCSIIPKPEPQTASHLESIQKLQQLSPELIIVTAARNRLKNLQAAHQLLISQQGGVHWAWVIADNNSDDGTVQYFQKLKDERVLVTNCNSQEGCAYPVRNHGLDTVAAAFWGIQKHEPWVTVIDSDDSLYNSLSLLELMQMTKCFSVQNQGSALVHGYSHTVIHHPDNALEHVPNPRDTSSDFPKIDNLSETFYKGLNILGGAFPIAVLEWLRYPPERSFEDGGFNEKLLLQAKKRHLRWHASCVPVTIKNFHRDSMSSVNNNRGDKDKTDKVGPYSVRGIRADIVNYYRKLMDYFTVEEL